MIKIGVIYESNKVPNWCFALLKKLSDDEMFNLVCLEANIARQNGVNRFKDRLFRWYRNRDYRSFQCDPDALDLMPLEDLDNFVRIELNSDLAGHQLELQSEAYDILENQNFDVIVNCSEYSLSDDISSFSRYGVWFIEIGNFDIEYRCLEGFWEVIQQEDEIWTSLKVRLANSSKSNVVFKSSSLTDNLSVYRGLNSLYWKSVQMLFRELSGLSMEGELYFKTNTWFNSTDTPLKDSKNVPSNLRMLGIMIYWNFRRVFRSVRSRFFVLTQWVILYEFGYSNQMPDNFRSFTKCLPPKDRFWADPFPINRNGKQYIFIEELIYSEGKGFISVLELDEEGQFKQCEKVLEEDHHLSFPFVFEDGNNFYMIPESKEAECIKLYKSIDFPLKWQLESILIDEILAVDTVVFHHKDKYWLFTNVVMNRGASLNDELYLFYSDELIGSDWISHPMNPIVSDVRKARMAGQIFMKDGVLFRPSQNCSKRYGYGIQINKITRMDERNYSEEEVRSITPDWEKPIKATHSINFSDNLIVIDALLDRVKMF